MKQKNLLTSLLIGGLITAPLIELNVDYANLIVTGNSYENIMVPGNCSRLVLMSEASRLRIEFVV